MKFRKEFSSKIVQEWQEAYIDHGSLVTCFNDIKNANPHNTAKNHHGTGINRKLTLYRAFSGLIHTPGTQKRTGTDDVEEGVHSTTTRGPIVVETNEARGYETKFLMVEEVGGGYELEFFRRLDMEFNKVDKFYKDKVEEVTKEALEHNKQMERLIAFRVKVENSDKGKMEERTVEMNQLASDIANSAAAVSVSTPTRAKSSE